MDIEGIPTLKLEDGKQDPSAYQENGGGGRPGAGPATVWSFIKQTNNAMVQKAKDAIRQTQQQQQQEETDIAHDLSFTAQSSFPEGQIEAPTVVLGDCEDSALSLLPQLAGPREWQPLTSVEPPELNATRIMRQDAPQQRPPVVLPTLDSFLQHPNHHNLDVVSPLGGKRKSSVAFIVDGNRAEVQGNDRSASPRGAGTGGGGLPLSATTTAASSRRALSPADMSHDQSPTGALMLDGSDRQSSADDDSSANFDRKDSYGDDALAASIILFDEEEEEGDEELLEEGLAKLSVKAEEKLFSEFIGLWMESTAVSVVVVLFLMFPTVLDTATAMLVCTTYDYGNGNFPSFLTVDQSISCTSATYKTYHLAGYAFLGAYGLGIPLCGILLVKLSGALKSWEYARKLFFFTTGGFKENMWFWDVVGLVRKGFLVVVTTLVDSSISGLICMWAMGLFLVVNISSTPWANPELSTLENISLGCTTGTFSLVLLLPFFPSDKNPILFTIICSVIIAINVFALLAFARAILKEVLISLSQAAKSSSVLQRISEILQVVASVETMMERNRLLLVQVDVHKHLVARYHRRLNMLQNIAVKELRSAAVWEREAAKKAEGMEKLQGRVQDIGTALNVQAVDALRDAKTKADQGSMTLLGNGSSTAFREEEGHEDDADGAGEDALESWASFSAFAQDTGGGGAVGKRLMVSVDFDSDTPNASCPNSKSSSSKPSREVSFKKHGIEKGRSRMSSLRIGSFISHRRSSVSTSQIATTFEKLVLSAASLSLAVQAGAATASSDHRGDPKKQRPSPSVISKGDIELIRSAPVEDQNALLLATVHNPLDLMLSNFTHAREEFHLQEAYQQLFQAELDFANAILMSVRRRGFRTLPNRANSMTNLPRKFH